VESLSLVDLGGSEKWVNSSQNSTPLLTQNLILRTHQVIFWPENCSWRCRLCGPTATENFDHRHIPKANPLIKMAEARVGQVSARGMSVVKKGNALSRLVPLFILQPVLKKIVQRIAIANPDMFDRLGPHRQASFLIDPVNLPFTLLLCPDPENLSLRALPRENPPPHDARIAGKFLDLFQLLDGDLDGDALFFSRDLDISGNTEAVVCLRNALDDVDGSVPQMVADMFGPLGRVALSGLRRAALKPKKRVMS
jgi:O2-independent ubiquinone biosynthesis accessory factor UbiT